MRGRKIRAIVRMTDREYRANITGLNVFFGAVLGFVLAGAEALGTIWFAALLMISAGNVILILYITASKHRVQYSIYAILLTATLGHWLEGMIPGDAPIPPKLQPALAVWALMTIFVEFLPREEPKGEVHPD